MDEDRFLLLKRHVASEGLSDQVIGEISDNCKLVRLEPGDYLHRANEMFTSIFLLIHGRIRQRILDFRGEVMLQRHQNAGAQFGALAAALKEPVPMDLIADEPCTLLELTHASALQLTKQHDDFRQNFSRMIADSVISLILRDRKQSRPRRVGFFHQSSETRPLVTRLIKRLQELGENPHLISDQEDWQPVDNVPYFNLVKNGTFATPDQVKAQIGQWSNSKRTFVDMDSTVDIELAFKTFEFCDKIFWCVTRDNWQTSMPTLRKIIARAAGWRDKINLVWLLPGDVPLAPPAPELREMVRRDFKISFDNPAPTQSRVLFNGFERIIHQLRGVRIGVALGGGAARGMAHLGVLKALEQNGIVCDMIAGTSAGAMTGIIYASGMEPDYSAECFKRDLKPSWLFRHLPNGGYWYLLYKYRRGQFDPMLRRYLKDSQLQQLPIDVNSVTVDLVSGQPVVRKTGDSVHAITESINLPGLSIPINRAGQSLVDGGIINNIPADVLVASGCNFVIAVSVTAGMEPEFASNRPDTPTPNMKKASTVKTIMRTFMVQSVNMNSVGVAPADFVIEPDVIQFDITEFTRADEMAAIGEETTKQSLPKLKELLSQIDRDLYPLQRVD